MEYLKEFIVDIYYNGGIYSVHLRKCFSYFIYYWQMEKIYIYEKKKRKKTNGVFKGVYSIYLL